jgi:hypothetical protein
MRTLTNLPLSALALALGISGAAAKEACQSAIAVSARAPNGLNLEPPQHYDTEKLARSRAIAIWKQAVATRCPRYSTLWWRARDMKVECEGYAVGDGCAVIARPARKL